jgi:VWFA-related protein
MKRINFVLAGAGFLLSALFAASIPAHQQAPPPQKPLQHEVAVTLKLIQVYVTDKDGKPILDLTKDDFIVTDDGKPQILTEFEKHIFSLPSPEAPAGEKLAATPLPATSYLLNRKVILFFDFGHSSPQGVIKAREAALHFLDMGLMPTDQVAMVSYALFTRLKVHEWLTTEQDKVRKLVERIGLRDSLGFVEDSVDAYQQGLDAGGIRDVTDGGAGVKNDPNSGGGGSSQATQSDARFQARNYISRLTSLARALRYEPGQKIIVLFSSGIPGSLFYNMEPPIAAKRDMNTDLRLAYEELCAQLATSNAVVYPIDMAPPSAASESRMGPATLMKMASVTGGRYMGNVNNYPEHFKKLQTLTAYYYVLGYSIDERWDGKYRKIKVSVQRPGCEVHTQAGYFNPKSFPDYTVVEKRIHLVDLALSENPLGQVPLRFPMVAQASSSDKEDSLCLAAEIPVAKIRERAGKKAEISCLVFDDRDEVVSEQNSEEDFAAWSDETAFVFSRASAPPGRYRCRIIVRNLETGAAAVAAATTVVPLKKEKGLQIYPPLFLKPDRGGHYLKGLLPKASFGQTPADVIAETFLFDTLQYVPQLEKTLKKNSEAWASVRCAFAGGQTDEIKLSAFLYDKQTREQIPVPLTIVVKRDGAGMKSYFLNFKIPEVEADEYRFCLVAEDPATGEMSMEVADFIIE